MDRMHIRKKMAPTGNECYNQGVVLYDSLVIMCSSLMDFTFDLYVFHFLEWS